MVKPLQRFYRRFGNKPYTKAVAGVLGDSFEEMVKKRRLDKLYSMVPYLLMVAEMAQNKEALAVMVDGIQSSEDLWAWIDYFTLPEEGWDGEGAPPRVVLNTVNNVDGTQVGDIRHWSEWFVASAIANNKRTPGKRGDGAVVGKRIVKAVNKLGDEVEATQITQSMRSITKNLHAPEARHLRKLGKTETFLVAATVIGNHGRKNFKNFMR